MGGTNGGGLKMAKKIILNLDYEHPFKAIGICSPQKDYRMCWLLNKHLETTLRRISDFQYVPHLLQESMGFPLYRYKNERLLVDYSLLANRSAGHILFAEPKNLDFLLMLRNPSDQFDPAALLSRLRKVPYVQAAFLLDGKLGKQENAFYFDFDLFLSQKGT
jgi:hypothetical protein